MLNPDIAYLLGMIIAKGSIKRGNRITEIIIDIPHKNLIIEGKDTQQSVKSSLLDITGRLRPLIDTEIECDTSKKNITHIYFSKSNGDYLIRTINTYLKNYTSWRDFRIPDEIFSTATSKDVKIEFLRGIADVTAHIRKSNVGYGINYNHRVYIEIMSNYYLCIDICNLLKILDIPVQTIRFAHPNFVDPNLREYNKGNKEFWNKENQIKVYAEEFEKVGFNIYHKNELLISFADLNRKNWKKHSEKSKKYKNKPISEKHHKFYWETKKNKKEKKYHPEENSPKLPPEVKRHFDSWKDMAKELGYAE